MSDTENVAGDVNKPVEDETSVAQNNLHNESNGERPLGVADVLGDTSNACENPATSAVDNATEHVNAETSEKTETADKVKDIADAAEEEPAEDDQGPKFDDLGLPEDILNAVKQVGFEQPSPIQAETIPVLMDGNDVVGLAQTGTGKTAAFALPILSRIEKEAHHPQALVLAPTRELALQVAESFQSFSQHLGGISVLPIYGGQSYGVQLSGLRRGAQIIVGTPGRVIDHLEKGSLDISNLRFMVLDEADEMLNMGFQEDVERILEDTPEEKQVALFSATMPNGIRRLSKQYLNSPVEITVKAAQRTSENIEQDYLLVSHRNKLDALTRILEVTEFEAMIMFVRTKNETEELAERLCARGFNAAAINGDIAQAQRERTVDQLKDGRLDILVATDVAARGLDVDRITHVFNYDIPHDTESYVHRIGRTGRAGRKGRAILFVTPRERRLLKAIERATKSRLNEIELPTVDEVNEARREKFNDALTESLGDPQMQVFRELVKNYAENNDVPMEDIAAALAAQMQSGEEFLMKEPPKTERPKRLREDRYGDDGRRGGGAARPFEERFNKKPPTVSDRHGNEFAVYRLNVGHRQRVRPGAIVGALANEGGLNSRDFGRISIFSEHSLVELPNDLPEDVFRLFDDTRVSGQLINIEPDPGAPAGRPGSHKRRDRGERNGGDRGGRTSGRGRYSDRDNRWENARGERSGRGGRNRFSDHGKDRGGFERQSRGRNDKFSNRRNDRKDRRDNRHWGNR
ncbi:DEAD/DEAH box helicase [Corynebacterium sp. 4HC-13]|uniref:DEAD/DEAH box helicase n=1 Tax=Corynebacterium anserum TaxID=2684406 RepID=UPI001639D2A7|nr:DEAD/DEAH box helicase [Corynebacterium anserum]MBC2681905.1 DEAD/DEAH box helicase [Corynebacterium anserum]